MKERLKAIAEQNGVGWNDLGDEVEFYIHFFPSDDYMWHKRSLLLKWKRTAEGKLNWWEDWVFDGRHSVSGPGYPAYAVHPQEPKSEDEFLAMVARGVKDHIAYLKQFKYRIK